MIDMTEIEKVLGTDKNFLVLMMDKYISEVGKEMQKLTEAAEFPDWKTIGEVSHKMLGSARMFAFNELGIYLEQLEISAKNEEKKEKIAELIQMISNELKNRIPELKQEKEKLENSLRA